MRKAKVVAIVCGIIASCLFGGFAVVEAATITLDDSSTTEPTEIIETVAEDTTEAAATETSIKTTAPAEASTTTKSVKTKETTAAPLETTTPASTAASVMTDAAETAAPRATAIEVKAAKVSVPASTQATTKATTKATTTTTTTTTTVVVTEPVVIQTVAPTEAVEDITNPPMPEIQAEAEPETVIDAPIEFEIPDPEPVVVTPPTSVSESDYILLCNAVAHEAGANNVPVVEKAKVVEVIMNRVASPNYPNNIYDVLTQKRQFSGSSTYVDLGTYSYKVTDMVKEAVDLYFADPSQFNHGYIGFWGDGKQNHFS